jgi:hypothetical protein
LSKRLIGRNRLTELDADEGIMGFAFGSMLVVRKNSKTIQAIQEDRSKRKQNIP